jgi:tripartite-type tricarboxylate transporter receptor subunit TctC
MFQLPLPRRRLLAAASLAVLPCAALLVAAPAARADAWPSRPIKLIIPYAAGGPTDVIGRLLASRISATLGQSVIVDNRAGAGGTIGVEATVKAPADGYTLALIAQGPLAGMPNLMKTPYGPDDVQYVSLVAKIPSVIAVSTKSGIDTLPQLLQKARAEPSKLSFSSAGPGTTQHIGMEILKDQAAVSLLHVPYKGAAPALTALLSGEVQVSMVDLLPVLPYVRAGSLKVLAVASARRVPQLPDVATTAEQGLPGVVMETTYGVIAPKSLPAPIAARVHDAIVAAVNSPDMQKQLLQQGAIPFTSTGPEYQHMIHAESQRWRYIIGKAHITLE